MVKCFPGMEAGLLKAPDYFNTLELGLNCKSKRFHVIPKIRIGFSDYIRAFDFDIH